VLPLALVCLSLLLVQRLIFEGYSIPTSSMEPTLMGHPESGDRVVVDKTRFVREKPERWMMAIFTRKGESQARVKRVVGLPGEEITIFKGDVFNRDRILTKPVALLEQLLIPVYDSGRDFSDFTEVWCQESGYRQPVEVGTGLRLFGDGCDEAIVLQTRDEITDGYVDRHGVRRRGAEAVGDLEVSLAFRVGTSTRGMEVRLQDGWDRIVFRMERAGPACIRLPSAPDRHAKGMRLRPGIDHGLRVSNIDDRLLVTLDDRRPLRFEYHSANRDRWIDPAGRRNMVEIRFLGGEVLLRRLRLRRDLYYTDRGHFATRVPVKVNAGSYFVLGDNSASSSDSREWGLVPRAGLIGAPVMILWPLNRLRLL